jgi:energy-coupling factor transport system ATP-binding protein
VIALDAPGAALALAAEAANLTPPTLVRLAEAASLDLARAFDERAVAAGLRAWAEAGRVARDSAGGPASDRARAEATATATERATADGPGTPPLPGPAWMPARDRAPVRVAIDGLVHRYPGGVEAVRGASLRVAPGEAVAILGQNGSGKTTLVKHLNGLLRPDEGRVLLDGVPTEGRSVADLARTVGFVFQNPDDQLFERSVEREVAFGPRNLGIATADLANLVAGSLAAVGLLEERTTNPYDLDLSRRKLVAMAGILAMDPAVLVLDEPTTGQDVDGVERVGAIVEAFRAAGRSVVTITHDMEFAARHSTRIVVMRAGEVVADGPPELVFAPANDALLASTGLTPPPAARIAARLGLGTVALDVEGLLAALRR